MFKNERNLIAILFMLFISSDLTASPDTLFTKYSRTTFIDANSIENNFVKNFITDKLKNLTCYKIETDKFINSILFIIDYSDTLNNYKTVSVFDSTFSYVPYNNIKKENDSLFYSAIELRSKEGYVLEKLNIVIDSRNKILFFRWDNPTGFNKPILSNKNKLFVGKKFPALTVKTLDGKTASLEGTKIKVINWCSTSCVPCREEIPGLNKLAEKYYSNEKIEFIAIISDNENLSKYLKKIILSINIIYPMKLLKNI